LNDLGIVIFTHPISTAYWIPAALSQWQCEMMDRHNHLVDPVITKQDSENKMSACLFGWNIMHVIPPCFAGTTPHGRNCCHSTLMIDAKANDLPSLPSASRRRSFMTKGPSLGWAVPRSSCRIVANPAMLSPMGDILKLIWWTVIGLFRSRASLEAEILVLRHQLNVLRRKSPKRLVFSNFDRLVFASLYRIAPRIVTALVIVKPEESLNRGRKVYP
jgi:hypothetical protein